MIGQSLSKWAKELALKKEKGFAHGVIDGYHITLEEGAGTKLLAVAGPFGDHETREALRKFIAGADAKLRITKFDLEEDYLLLTFPDTVGVPVGMKQFLPELLKKMRELGCAGEGICALCGKPLGAEDCQVRLVHCAANVHSACFDGYRTSLEQRLRKRRQRVHGNSGIFGAVIGSLLTMAVWLILQYFSVFTAWVGILTVLATWKGYELTGGKNGKSKFWTVLICSLLSIAFSQVIGQYIVACQYYMSSLGNWPELSTALALLWKNLKENPDYVSYCIRSVLEGYFFAALVLIYLGMNVAREKSDPLSEVVRL